MDKIREFKALGMKWVMKEVSHYKDYALLIEQPETGAYVMLQDKTPVVGYFPAPEQFFTFSDSLLEGIMKRLAPYLREKYDPREVIKVECGFSEILASGGFYECLTGSYLSLIRQA